MKQYPTISRDISYGFTAYVFDKLDGSQIRAEWSRKKNFYKFGSRKRLLGTDQDFLVDAEDLIRIKYEKDVTDILRKKRIDRAVCFFEFFGPNSFAGVHCIEKHDVVIFDVSVYKKGVVAPREFLKLFNRLDVPVLLHYGSVNKDLETKVRQGSLEGMGQEGVVCKGAPLKKGYPPHMFKIKRDDWVEKLRVFCKGDDNLFKKLL